MHRGTLEVYFVMRLSSWNSWADEVIEEKTKVANLNLEGWERCPLYPMQVDFTSLEGPLTYEFTVDAVARLQRNKGEGGLARVGRLPNQTPER
jgi:hypothetical protein